MAGHAITKGTRVKLILDKERSPDNQWHGKKGTVVNILFDDADSMTDDPANNMLLDVELDDPDVEVPDDVHFRRHDVQVLEE